MTGLTGFIIIFQVKMMSLLVNGSVLVGQSPGSVNQHLSVLRGSGLVVSRRSGRSVLYRQTPLAQSMIAAQQVARHGTLGTLPPTRLRR